MNGLLARDGGKTREREATQKEGRERERERKKDWTSDPEREAERERKREIFGRKSPYVCPFAGCSGS